MITSLIRGLLAACGAVALSGAACAADIQVIATGAMKGAFKQLAPAFEQASGHRLRIVWGPSYGNSPDAIPTRLAKGEPVDVLVMVGAALDDRLGDGRFDPATRADLAQSAIGVGVRQGASRPDIGTPEALKHALLAAKTIGHSEGASGKYIADTLFRKMGIAEQVAPKIVVVHGKELVGQVVARGEAEIGLQQISELMVVPGVDYLGPLPESLQKTSVISAIVASGSSQADAARAFVRLLATPASAKVFAASGLIPVSPARAD
jgi:molybdate transport system substrate-binding protein